MAQFARETIKIPSDLGPQDRKQLAEEIIDFIIENAKSGVGARKHGESFRYYPLSSKPYTEEYAKKKGVSRTSVDLTYDDEMLNAMEVISTKKGEVTIGYKQGNDQNGKAEGNIIGSYGKSPNKKKARPFIGITQKDLLELL